MDNKEWIDIVKHTKQGKWGIVFLVLAVLSLVAIVASTADIATGIVGFLVFLAIASLFLNKGRKALHNPSVSSDKEETSTNAPATAKFKPTKKVGKYLSVDDINKKWCVPHSKESKAVYDYSDLLDYELVEDGNTVTSGSLGRAIAGGLAFGGIGAVVGGMSGKQKPTCNKLQIRMTVKDMKHPTLYINLLDFEVKKESEIYKSCIKDAQEIVSILMIIKSNNE